jgi:hypothetical protein
VRKCWLYLRLLGSCNGIRLGKGGIHLILCLALLHALLEHALLEHALLEHASFKTAIKVVPVPPVLYFMDQVWAGAVLSHFVTALKWVETGSLFYLGGLVGF